MADFQSDFNAGIVGLGVYLPEDKMTEQDFINAGVPKESLDKWGVYEHRVSKPDELPSDMSIKAALNLIENTGIDPKEIDLIIDSALVSDYMLPGNSHRIQYELGAKNATAFDILPSNGGAIPLLIIARSLILSNMYKNILITCSCKFSAVADKTDWQSVVIGGDGAAAILVSRVCQDRGILSSNTITKGEFYSNSGIKMNSFSNYPGSNPMAGSNLNNQFVFFLNNLNILKNTENKGIVDEFYLQSVPDSSKAALEAINLCYNDVDYWIMHQNAKSLCDQWVDILEIKAKGNYYYSYNKYGNLFNVNLLVNLKEAVEQAYIKDGDIVVLSGVIVGLSAGSVVMKWGK